MTTNYLANLMRGSFKMAEAVVVGGVVPALFEIERHVVKAIRQHLEQLDAPDSSGSRHSEGEKHAPPLPATVLGSLLERALFYSADDNRNELYSALLQALVPDEARILAAVSDGSAYPVVHVAEPTTTGSNVTVLANASSVGRVAGVSLPSYTPLYLTRMLQAGLVAIGPEGPSTMANDYEVLLADDAVNLAQVKARRGMRGAKVTRRTVSITALGREVWEAAK
ncbi:hypothetical protein BRW65_24585 [Mycobacterium paraffinicum]|uniref:DUF4393 domain-containing protein n=1 Tax=Mycobacterium paraffinicum TaxID=53378 RepID=A0A1Q4HNA3_9MYCO|nr:hypothetical protein [Mycobacterium paraffinicum]OJZ68922.1 hypothetical protein BRW65_24585 [Mycobacterium paraffinicum]